MGAGKICCSLVVDPALFGPTDWRRRWWRSLHHTESGTQDWGLESKFGRDLDTRDRRVMDWSCLCLEYKWGVCFRGTQLDILVRESSPSRYDLFYL